MQQKFTLLENVLCAVGLGRPMGYQRLRRYLAEQGSPWADSDKAGIQNPADQFGAFSADGRTLTVKASDYVAGDQTGRYWQSAWFAAAYDACCIATATGLNIVLVLEYPFVAEKGSGAPVEIVFRPGVKFEDHRVEGHAGQMRLVDYGAGAQIKAFLNDLDPARNTAEAIAPRARRLELS